MKFRNIKNYSVEKFRRITGVKPDTFWLMVDLVKQQDVITKALGGRPHKLCVEDRVLITLEYLREYRTYAHIGASWGISESAAFQGIRSIENTLIQSKEFHLPGKKALLKTDTEFEVILIDATESPIERPKKNSGNFSPARKNVTR